MPKLSIAETFLESLLALPDQPQKKTREMMTKFKNDPKSSGLNYETIKDASDSRYRSIRVDRSYRAIILKPDTGDTFLFVWVDSHDEAYAWARKRRYTVNKYTGTIEVVEVNEGTAQAPSIPEHAKPVAKKDERPGLFDPYSQADLLQLGASEELIPTIREIREEAELHKLERHLPGLLYEGLFMLACDEKYDDVLVELGIVEGEEFDPDDIEAVIELPGNKDRFASFTEDKALDAMLNEPLAKWRVFLHPSQRKLVRMEFNGPARVLGGAGTGKTVVAMHRAQYLSSKCEDNERILFTTFTKSLVADIKANLQKICSFDELRRIDVIHLDKWSINFLRSKGLKHELIYGSPSATGHKVQYDLWNRALDLLESGEFTEDFVRQEWERVVQYHDIQNFQEYAKVPRAGRRNRLSRLQRAVLWPVFQEYRNLLDENQLWEGPDMMRAARSVLQTEGIHAGYKHILVDEIQDFHPQAFRLLRAMVPPEQFTKNDLFLVGDGHQNIYGHHVVLGQLGINIRGRGRRLRLNYRTPEETRQWATAQLKGVEVNDLDGEADTHQGYVSVMQGPMPVEKSCATFGDDITAITEWITQIRADAPSAVICIACRSGNDQTAYAEALEGAGFGVHKLTSTQHDVADPGPIRVATMHRVKGLEFDHVCLAGQRKNWDSFDAQRLTMERCLVHVAATRTKNSLLVTTRS